MEQEGIVKGSKVFEDEINKFMNNMWNEINDKVLTPDKTTRNYLIVEETSSPSKNEFLHYMEQTKRSLRDYLTVEEATKEESSKNNSSTPPRVPIITQDCRDDR